MATEGVVPSAKAISAAFVEQYYHVLRYVPHEAHKLYVDDSVFSRPSPDGTMLSFTSVEVISEHKVLSFLMLLLFDNIKSCPLMLLLF